MITLSQVVKFMLVTKEQLTVHNTTPFLQALQDAVCLLN